MFVRLLRTTISLFVLLQMALFSITDGSSDETIYNELILGKRPILTIGKLAHSSQVVLLVGQLNKPEDIYVYEIPVAQTTSISKLVFSGGVLFSKKWPVIYNELAKVSTVFLVSDSAHDYLMLYANMFNKDVFAAYNIKDANLAKLGFSFPRHDVLMISSTDVLSSFFLQKNLVRGVNYFRRFHYLYNGPINTKQVFLPNTTTMSQTGDSLNFCSSTTTEFIMAILAEAGDCPDDAIDCVWNITSGFVDNHQITLFDQDGSVYMFPRSTLDADLSIPIKLVKDQFSNYFVLSKNEPTIVPNTSNVSVVPVNTESNESNIGFIVVIAILVIALLFGIVLYFVNPCKTSSKKEKAIKAAIIDSPKDRSGKATEKNDQAPKESAKPKAKDKTSVKVGQTGKPGGRSGKRTAKTGRKGSGARESRSKQSSKDKTGGHAAPSANSSQADSAMSAQSQPQNKSSSASSAPKKDSHSGASFVRKAKRSPGNSKMKKIFAEKKLIQLGIDQYKDNSLE